MDSRVNSTRAVGQAIARAAQSAPGLAPDEHRHHLRPPLRRPERRGDRHPRRVAKPDAPDTWRFSIDVARRGSGRPTRPTPRGRGRWCCGRRWSMSPDRGGVFDVLLGLVRRGLGGPAGDGRQYVSWIHDRDFVRAVYWLIDRPELAGPVNLASPNPLPNARVHARPPGRVGGPGSACRPRGGCSEVGALVMRTETELILKSRRVVPGRLVASGLEFQFPVWSEAASELCRRWRKLTWPASDGVAG